MRKYAAISAPILLITACTYDDSLTSGDSSESNVNETSQAMVTPTDPLACEQPDFSPVSPEHYKTYQWHLGCNLYGSPKHVYALNAWDYTQGHALLGFLDGGIATFSGTAPNYQINSIHPALVHAFREHISPSYGLNVRAAYGTEPFGHGIHTMGLAVGRADGSGTIGICPNCSTVLSNIGIGGFEYMHLDGLIDSGTQVINISLRINDEFNTKSKLLLAAQRDVVLVAAAGNWPRNEIGDQIDKVEYPANAISYGVVAVAGSAPAGTPWNESGTYTSQAASKYGAEVLISAPAKSIYSSFYPDNSYNVSANSQPPCGDSEPLGHPSNDGYGLCTGTSMATPIVTGIVGLVRSINPLLPVAGVRAALTTGATPFSVSAPGFGQGIVHAQHAIEAVLPRSNGVIVKNRLTPLFSLYSHIATDALYTTVPQYAVASIHDSGRRMFSSPDPTQKSDAAPYVSRTGDPTVAGYSSFPDGAGQVPAAAVYIFSAETNPLTGIKDLVPLYRMSYIGPYAGNLNHRDHSYATDAQGIAAYSSLGYKLDGIEGYIYPKLALPPTGTVRLLRRYNPTRDDHAIFPETQLAAMQAEGYTQLSGSDWLGYVYPNVDSDADGLVDGFELLLKTDPHRIDSDCDGVADGVEVPLAALPVSDPLDAKCPAHDFDGDGKADIAWRNPSSGLNVLWRMDGTSLLSIDNIFPLVDASWIVGGVGDFNGDGKADLMWRNPSSGLNVLWRMDGTSLWSIDNIFPLVDASWIVGGVGDFNGDGKADLMWRNPSTGMNAIWAMNGATVLSGDYVYPSLDANWIVGGVGDFNGDGKADLMWRNPSTGVNAIWSMNGATVLSGNYINPIPDSNWTVALVEDFDGNNKSDLFWRNVSTGATSVWLMNGAAIDSTGYLPTVSSSWLVSR